MSDFFENQEKASLQSLGEFGLIEHMLQPNHQKLASTFLSAGDDAALLDHGGPNYMVWSSDLLIEGVHFDLMYTPLKHLGYKAVAVNVSDICAMNGKATQILVSIALSSKYTLDAVEELYEGIYLACKQYNIDLVGGDTTTIGQGMALNISVLGTVEKGKEVKRSGAKEGDLLCVSGDLGAAYMGLQLLEREKRVYLDHPGMQPDLQQYTYILQRQLRPEARVDIIDLFAELKIRPSSMIDVSDGLSSEVFHLSKHSALGFKIYEEKLPIDHQTSEMALEFGIGPSTAVLNGGEDYELLFTLPQNQYDAIKKNPDITVIGYACSLNEGNQLITQSGNAYDLKAQGWKSF